MSDMKYIKLTEDEKEILQEAREKRFGRGRRVTLGAFSRILAENSMEGE